MPLHGAQPLAQRIVIRSDEISCNYFRTRRPWEILSYIPSVQGLLCFNRIISFLAGKNLVVLLLFFLEESDVEVMK
jgi:hypothetical protein